MTRPTMMIPGIRCPKCGAAEGLKPRLLCIVGSREIGRTRQRDYVCRRDGCGRTFRVNITYDWTDGTDSAKATVID